MGQKDEEKAEMETKKILDRIQSNKMYPIQNKQAVEKFYTSKKAQGCKVHSLNAYTYYLEKFINALDKVRYDTATHEDIEKAVATLQEKKWSKRTKYALVNVVKMFYRYTLGEGVTTPTSVARLRNREPQSTILSDNLLTPDDIIKLVDGCSNLRDKAVIAILYDTGARIGELLNIRLRDINFGDDITNPRVRLDGRQVLEVLH